MLTVILPSEQTKIKSCTCYSCNYPHKYTIDKLIEINIISWCSSACIQNCKKQSCCNYYSVPVYRIISNRKSHGTYLKFKSKSGKIYIISHITPRNRAVLQLKVYNCKHQAFLQVCRSHLQMLY